MNRYILITTILLAIVAGSALYSETRPNPELLRFEAQGDRAYGHGYTTGRSIGQTKRFIRSHPQVEILVLKSMSGTKDSNANLDIARFIRRQGLNTHLEADSYIASGAVDLFLSGTNRTMECGAKIGVHSWSSPMGEKPIEGQWDRLERQHKRFLTAMGIKPGFYLFTRRAAPPEGIYWLTMEDIKRFDLLSEYPDCPKIE